MPVTGIGHVVRSWMRAACWRVYKIGQHFEERRLPEFATRPRNLTIRLPRRIQGAERIAIGDDVTLGPGSLLVTLDCYPSVPLQDQPRPRAVQKFDARIVIGHRVSATGGLTVAAHQEIVIEDDVLFAANVNLTDGLHGFGNANEPYRDQPIFRIAPIRIGRGSWIGQNVVVMPGVTIGELSIVGANSVVTRDIPARSIAVGTPARVIKRWHAAEGRWAAAESVPEVVSETFSREGASRRAK